MEVSKEIEAIIVAYARENLAMSRDHRESIARNELERNLGLPAPDFDLSFIHASTHVDKYRAAMDMLVLLGWNDFPKTEGYFEDE